MKRLLRASAMALIVALLVVTAAYAFGSLKTVTVTYNVIDPAIVKSIEVYTDPTLTQVADTVPLGDIERGASKQFTLYVKNTGTTNVTLSTEFVITDDVLSAIPNTPITLEPTTSGTWTFTLSVPIGSSTGVKSANIKFGE